MPRAVIRYEETYCVFSAWMIRAVQLLLIAYFVNITSIAVGFIVGDKYQAWFMPNIDECSLIPNFRNIFSFEILDEKLADFFFSIVILLQIFEWNSILFIITTQKHRSVEQIMYDHNNENVSDPINWKKTVKLTVGIGKGKISFSQNIYRRREKYWRNFYIFSGLIFISVHIFYSYSSL